MVAENSTFYAAGIISRMRRIWGHEAHVHHFVISSIEGLQVAQQPARPSVDYQWPGVAMSTPTPWQSFPIWVSAPGRVDGKKSAGRCSPPALSGGFKSASQLPAGANQRPRIGALGAFSFMSRQAKGRRFAGAGLAIPNTFVVCPASSSGMVCRCTHVARCRLLRYRKKLLIT
jgi:hypothetical protein